ncbi:MAG: hypothetical protein IPM32_09005 [Ignavibacteriae bacterium]|nr:hypothetical protein [Ignavibacteriota bacterium]
MKYVKFEIEGLRRIKKANFIFSEATFLMVKIMLVNQLYFELWKNNLQLMQDAK